MLLSALCPYARFPVQEDVTKRRAELIREAERDRAELVVLRDENAKLRAENRRAVRGEVRAGAGVHPLADHMQCSSSPPPPFP